MAEQSHLARFAEFVIGDDSTDLGIARAERDYALHCLEREIAIAQSEQARCGVLVQTLAKIRAILEDEIHDYGPSDKINRDLVDEINRLIDPVSTPSGGDNG